ncbi:unnamed protein product, partial [Hymenolepis diminuta]
ERRAVIVPTKAKHRNLENVRSVKVARSFVCRARKELNENNGVKFTSTRKRKQYCQRSVHSLRTPEFV